MANSFKLDQKNFILVPITFGVLWQFLLKRVNVLDNVMLFVVDKKIL